MARLQEIAPQIHWAYEQVKKKYPQRTFKIRWDEIAEVFVIATDDSSIRNNKEFSRFAWDLEYEIAPKCPYDIYFTYDSALNEDEDYDIEDYDIDIEWYELEEESN